MISYLNINEVNIDEISRCVSGKRLDRASKLKHEKDRLRSIAVEYLLNTMIEEIQGNTDEYMIPTPVELEYDEHGKPHVYTIEGDEIYFSLSHSGDYVACIIADKSCGIDIERHSDRDYEKIARRICTDSELEHVKTKEEFYQVWTLKESVMKAEGLGLALDMKKIETGIITDGHTVIRVGDRKYYGFCVEAPEGYSLSYVY